MRQCGTIVYDCTQRLCECVRSCLRLICCCCCANKVSSVAETRLIEVGVIDEKDRKKHNKIKTSKYTFLMFLPKNLSEQFRRVANFYFLVVTVIAVVIDTPVAPWTSIAPLSFMVFVTAVKQGYEDWLRHKADNKVNNQIGQSVEDICFKNKKLIENTVSVPPTSKLVEIVYKNVIKEVRNCTIAPGTLVRVKRGVAVPADLVLLCSASEQGKCYVTTANLDGETNLKTLRVPPPLVGYSPDILPQAMKIEVPHPEADLYTFYGRIEIPGHDTLALTTDNLMLRGSRVKNTEWAIGCAVYTGEETKLALNSKYSGNKFSSCELAINGFLLCFIFLLIIEMCGSLLAKILFERRYPHHDVYLGEGTPIPAPFSYLLQDLFSFLLLYYYIIPMSLYVTIELYKFIGALFIGWDEELRCEETGRPALANTSDLNEELGQVEVLFSDKTGTLTKNFMVFKTCSIRGAVYEEREGKFYDMERPQEAVDTGQAQYKLSIGISSCSVKRSSSIIEEPDSSLDTPRKKDRIEAIDLETQKDSSNVLPAEQPSVKIQESNATADAQSNLPNCSMKHARDIVEAGPSDMSKKKALIETEKDFSAVLAIEQTLVKCEESDGPFPVPVLKDIQNVTPCSSLYSTPKKKKLGSMLRWSRNIIRKKNLQIKRLQTKNRRLKRKIESMEQLLKELGEKFAMSNENLICLKNTNVETDIKFFFTVLALCHSVQISNEDMKRLSARLSANNFQLMSFFKKKRPKAVPQAANGAIDDDTWNNIMRENGSHIDYQASSPDEKALVEVAHRAGCSFLGEDGNNLLVEVAGRTELFERLQVIEFTSERKRMSVIVRDKDGTIWLFCKGAESAVFPLCKNVAMVDMVERDINLFANRGLRTLAVAYRQISDEEYEKVTEAIKNLDGRSAEALQQVAHQYRVLERSLTLVGATGVEDCLQDEVAGTLAALRRANIRVWVLTGDKVETAINVAKSCNHISENDRQLTILNVQDEESTQAHLAECSRIVKETNYRDLTLVVDGTSMSQILDSKYAPLFVDVSLKCNAVLCCRLSPIQKAEIVKLIKHSPERPVTAAIGDGANDISMIQEAHVGFGIFGKEGHQAARSADFAFTKFSMIKKMLLVMGHWYYQRLATLIHYFFYKNLVLGNLMVFFQASSMFSTQSVFDSMYLTTYNLVFTSVPCLLLSVTEQRYPPGVLLQNPTLYRRIRRNKLMGWRPFLAWCSSSVYHSVLIYWFTALTVRSSVINTDGKNMDLWTLSAVLFHMLIVVTNLKLWLQARYHSFLFVASVVLSILIYIAFNTFYSAVYLQVDGDVLGTYLRLLTSLSFWMLNVLLVVACLLPDFLVRLMSEKWGQQWTYGKSLTTVFTTRL